MIYESFSLSGTWRMDYCEDKYESSYLPEIKGAVIENAVPGYWEDMTESFEKAPFCHRLKINPEYSHQQYPIVDTAPDMLLPNIVGNFFYSRTFICDKFDSPSCLHFGGVQSSASVWLNGVFLGRHEGYSTPFDIEIPDGVLIDGENTVVLSVCNHRLEGFDGQPVSGITSRAASEYSGGIIGDIELRVYSCPLRDVAILVSEDCKAVECRVESVGKAEFAWSVLDGDRVVKSGESVGDFCFDSEDLELWSPESPKLYVLKIVCGEAVLERSFGVRRLTTDGPHFRLNGQPCYLRGVCEHCYYPISVHPVQDIEFYRDVIGKLKTLGFNFIRFHTHIPPKEYMQAADELGMLLHVESPNNTSLDEWKDIVTFCRRYTSVVIYCCGNELQLYDDFLEHIHLCADEVHGRTDSLFSPMSALRGLEYNFEAEPELMSEVVLEPMRHNPRRFRIADEFSDMYSSYSLAHFSYASTDAKVKDVSEWSYIYNNKPRVTHEICIDGTYTDLSVKERYKNTRIGKTDMFDSIERHLADKGVLDKAPLYFRNSCEWQRRVRKYCFEATRRCENMAGYDFLGPIDTHWHTFGYDVGMMNEFYELKPGESVQNVLRYNSPTVLLNDLERRTNFFSGEHLCCDIYASCYGFEQISGAVLDIKLVSGEKLIRRDTATVDLVGGTLPRLYNLDVELPEVDKPCEMKLCATLEGPELSVENEWELYLFPRVEAIEPEGLVVSGGMSEEELISRLRDGEDVVIFGAAPFVSLPTSFKIALAGRTSGNLATVIADHPILQDMPHESFCSWQFNSLLEKGRAICFEADGVPFDPIVEVVSTHKNVIRQAALFEFSVLAGRLIVCGFNFSELDPAAVWLKNEIIKYAQSKDFVPKQVVGENEIRALIHGKVSVGVGNTNFALNLNDKTAIRKKK
ncbi:MAG: beta galactosidase jelly roll domain-containing protein [Clostridia bacterium]|nr:beta galactosidase jelly roll domain-containing protein [Clostridia bacterium]